MRRIKMKLLNDNLLVEPVDTSVDEKSGLVLSTELKTLSNVYKVKSVPSYETEFNIGDYVLVKSMVSVYTLPNDAQAYIIPKDYVISILEDNEIN